jgi:hypothetical protein
MAWFWWLLVAVVIVLWVATIIDIIRRRHSMSGGKLAAWLIVMFVFPVLGTIVYFVIHAGQTSATPLDADRVTRYPGGSA